MIMGGDTRAERNYVIRALELFDRYGDAEALVKDEQRLSYAQLKDMTLHLAGVLHDQGLRPGEGVGVLVRDRPDTLPLQLALHLLGCRTVWIATYAPPRDQADYFRLARAGTLIYSGENERREELAAALLTGPGEVRVFSLGPSRHGADLRAMTPEQPPDAHALAGGEPQSLFYTGGTTGRPKLVHHDQAFYQALLFIAEYYLSVGEPAMRFLYGASFTHVSGQMPAFLTLFEGGTLFMFDGYDPADFLATIEKERVTSTFLTPALLYQVIDHPAMATADTSSLRYLNVGGAAASPARLRDAIARLGPVIRIVYGSSEVPLITDYPFLEEDPGHPERLRSAGRPFADTRLEIRDAAGTVLPTGTAGEVWARSSLTMTGYWQQADLTADTVSDGWIRTGDVGYLDEDGYLYLVDRVSDMIVTGEYAANVYARPIEDVLMSHPLVRTAAVIGVPHEGQGEALRAYVVLSEPGAGTDAVAGELRELVRAELNELYTPAEIEFTDGLPLTPVAKVDKKALRERYLTGRATPPGQGA
jgi:fatty-acyl-CoA synthase